MERFVYFKNIDNFFLESDTPINEVLSYEDTVNSLDLYSHDIDPFLTLTYLNMSTSILDDNPFSTPEDEKKLLKICNEDNLRHVVLAKHQQRSEMKILIQEDISELKDNITTPLAQDTNGFQFSAKQVFLSFELKLDIYSELYFSLLNNLNKNKYVDLLLPEWNIGEYKNNKNKREFFLQKLREYRKYERTELFEIDFSHLKTHEILDVSPNISRLLIISKEFRTMMRDTNNPQRKFYQFLPMKIQEITNDWSLIPKTDDDILLERLLGFEVSLALYELFSLIFPNQTQDEVKKHFDIMEKIIKTIMEWPGEHSRSFIINELTNYIKRVRKNTNYRKVDNVLIFIEQNLNLFISLHIDKYYLLLKNTLYYEYIHSSKDKEILEYKLEEIAIRMKETYSSCLKPYKTVNKSCETVKYEYIYQFIQGCVIKYACKRN